MPLPSLRNPLPPPAVELDRDVVREALFVVGGRRTPLPPVLLFAMPSIVPLPRCGPMWPELARSPDASSVASARFVLAATFEALGWPELRSSKAPSGCSMAVVDDTNGSDSQ